MFVLRLRAAAASFQRSPALGLAGAAAGLSRSGKPGGVSGRLVNVFEQLWNRRKFDILGRKVKGDVRAKSIGKARSAAVEKAQLSRKNRFSLGDDDESDDDDGEGDDGGGGGEGRRSSRRAAASEDGDLRLTHGGRDIDDFDDSDVSGLGRMRMTTMEHLIVINSYMCGGDEDDKHARGREIDDFDDSGVSGFSEDEDDDDRAQAEEEGGEERQKTKREVMEEVMAKSKLFKAKRQAEKEKKKSTLDAATGQEEGGEERQKTKREVMEEVMAKSKLFQGEAAGGEGGGRAPARAARRGIPPDRTEMDDKQYDLLAREMVVFSPLSLPPAFYSPPPFPHACPLSPGDGLTKQYDVLAREMVFDIRAKPGNAPRQQRKRQRRRGRVCEARGRAAAEVGVAIARIRACNAAHLSPDNKRKMQIFYNVLLQYFASLASDSGGGGVSQRKRAPSVAAAHINALVQPLVELSASFPLFAAVCARERLARMQKRLVARLKAGGTPLVELSASFSLFAAVCARERLARMQKRLVARLKAGAWPTARTLLLLRLWALIFPSSDFRHPVMTPVSLLLGQFLSCCPMVSQSRRFVPEALNFLHALLWSAVAPALKPVKPKVCFSSLSFYPTSSRPSSLSSSFRD
ncbi:unnamed protein product [Closterium sp. NIES-64]|nr:unnamed protein product [Closterium sp. NIES-64]